MEGEPQRRRGPVEWGAVILLLIGGIVIPVVGWIVGALLLWVSQAWTLRDKLIGTLLVPGGLLPAAWFVFAPASVETCGSAKACGDVHGWRRASRIRSSSSRSSWRRS